MYRTMIVDDDFLVRSYLKQLDAWQRAGCEIVADVRDGEEALKVYEEQKPDVIITDISMPLMDGIELIRQIRKENESVYIIVLSCHDDFEYVKEAMKLGANEYVLKNSLDEESLYELLKNAENQMESLKEKYKEVDEKKRLIEMGRHSLKYHYFNGLLAGSFDKEERDKKRREAGIWGKFINSAVINMFIPLWSALKGQYSVLELDQYSQRFLQKLDGSLEILLGDEHQYVEEVYLGEGVFCCFLDLSEMRRSSLMKQRLTSVATACFRCCKEEKYDYAIGVSNICFGEEGIRQAYQQAREIIKLSFYEESDILYYEGQPQIGREIPGAAEKLLGDLENYVKGHQYEEMKAAFVQVIDACRKNYTDSRIVTHWLKELDQKAQIERNQEAYGGIVKIEQLMDICEEYRQKLFLKKKKEIPKGTSPVIHTVVDFLHDHYKEQIGLTEAAQAAGLNPAYLSYLFKQEMGVGLSNYILDLRIECAKGMLLSTNEKIKEVASKSGFNDYHYFSKTFKKINGVSPADYRKIEKDS